MPSNPYSPPGVSQLSTVYCADEDLAVRCPSDFALLAPDWQTLAAGTDGVFSAGDLWTLSSASANFTAAGIEAQHVVQLTGPKPTYKGTGILMAVDSVTSATAIKLRRIGNASGVGQAPGPSGGLIGITYAIQTLGPQIEEESFNLNQRFAIDPTNPGRTPSDIKDIRVLRWATVLAVLYRRYVSESRDQKGDFAMKAQQLREELSEVYGRLTIRWVAAPTGQDKTTFATTRIER